MEKEIAMLEKACVILARAIEEGRISGLTDEILELLGYIDPKS